MNYEALTWLIKSILINFRCDNCTSFIYSKDINLVNIEWRWVTLSIDCPRCKKKSMIKSEVVSIDLSKLDITEKQLMWIKNTFNDKSIWDTKNLINDNFIVELDKNLKKEKLKAEDLFL